MDIKKENYKFNEIKNTLKKFMNENNKEFVKALISIEKNIEDQELLEDIYNDFMDDDSIQLLDSGIDEIIDNYIDFENEFIFEGNKFTLFYTNKTSCDPLDKENKQNKWTNKENQEFER